MTKSLSSLILVPAAVLGLTIAAPTVWAQPLERPVVRAWGPTLDSLSLSLANRGHWRGHVVGGPTLLTAVDIALYGYPVTAARHPTPWGLSARGSALLIRSPRDPVPAGSRLDAALALSRRMGSSDAFVELAGSIYEWLDVEEGRGQEVGVGIGNVRLPLFAEPDIILDAAVIRDWGVLDGVHANAGLAAALTPPFLEQRLEVRIGGRVMGDSYLERSFALRSTIAELGAAYQLGAPGMRPVLLTADVGGHRVTGEATYLLGRVGLLVR
jgi:hypothetical protein